MINGLYIKANAPSGGGSVGATLTKTGQTTSYRTGDDGDLEAGRATSFTILASNNPFGNTNRFTDELGGTTYANNWVIDWSTYNGTNVLGYYRVVQSGVWNTAVDNSLGTFGTFSGCRLTNIFELMNITKWEASTHAFNYAPFNITLGSQFWSSTTLPINTGFASCFQNNTFQLLYATKGTALVFLPCRTFTVSGTILT